jgi:hypothetical protein
MNTLIRNIFIAGTILTALVGYSVAHPPTRAQEAPTINATASATLKEVVYPPVEEYIRLTFGVYADKAMRLLTDPACHENLYLDPKAVNDNTSWGGIGRDRGIFQISDVYHPGVSDACAFDYKCNIDYAYRMFVNDNYTFKRWTCGRELGI